jgi:hypothetical protein
MTKIAGLNNILGGNDEHVHSIDMPDDPTAPRLDGEIVIEADPAIIGRWLTALFPSSPYAMTFTNGPSPAVRAAADRVVAEWRASTRAC